MKITKFGHCCMLVEEKGLRILFDPGNFSTAQDELMNIDVILITHEHSDHIHIDSLKTVLKNNPTTTIMTNNGVGVLLDKEGIKYTLVELGQVYNFKGVNIEGIGEYHAIIYETMPIFKNTGFMIADRLFYPGDAFTDPGKPVEILALPAAGPWMKISEAIDYARQIKPNVCFPVHDGIMLRPEITSKTLERILPTFGIEILVLEIGKETEF